MDESKRQKILGDSSGWVAVLLNFLPGLGAGYIYQRRWKAYWITTIVSALWVFFDISRELGVDPSDPGAFQSNQSGFFGLFIIASITAIEAWIAAKRAREME